MVDVFSPEDRSLIMAKIKSRDTKPELVLRRTLWAAGARGWRCHRTDLPGRPDIAFGPAQLAVFVDGAFWHGHPSKYKEGQSGDFWDRKIAANMARDREADIALEGLGWAPLRLWDFEVMADPPAAATQVQERLHELGP
ncbi:MAG: DNA mismatch endonuclease Vsr [Acidimicrobiia bacterium]|nr:DNA mismatch endonuclease Vsr [Acidimicrobiia bacterium]